MKKTKLFLLFIITLAGTFLFSNTYFAQESNNKKTDANVTLTKDPSTQVKDDDGFSEKDTIYNPVPAKTINLLPQTGEIVTSFIFIIIGLSVLIFILGIYINKIFYTDMIEMEIQL